MNVMTKFFVFLTVLFISFFHLTNTVLARGLRRAAGGDYSVKPAETHYDFYYYVFGTIIAVCLILIIIGFLTSKKK